MPDKNNLYPIFLKVTSLNILIVGGGNVALEKLTFLFRSSPNAQVEIVAPIFKKETIELSQKHNVKIYHQPYEKWLLKNKHIVIVTTDKPLINQRVYKDCKYRSILVNLADEPDFCDFYMGSIVNKGSVKIAISTNGNSPTMAKRLREFFESVIPDSIDILAQNLKKLRSSISGNFEERVNKMNAFTETLLEKEKSNKN